MLSAYRMLSLPAVLLLAACQPTVYLMPTPEVLRGGQLDPFPANTEESLDRDVRVAYATNRMHTPDSSQWPYITLFDQDLRLGVATVRLGKDVLSAEELHASSTVAERELDIPLFLVDTRQDAVLKALDRGAPLPPEAMAFFEHINTLLARSRDPDITVYVHGANNTFYRSSAQAAQYAHFTGRNSVVMFFSWPSAESILRYAVDVNNARRTVPVFAYLIELLAQHTDARYIDILAYSAGAQVLSPALASLRAQEPGQDGRALRERLRLGEIYFAAPDVDFSVFLRDLASYDDMVQHVTLALNPNDQVLALAARHHGVSRAGRPDPNELTEQETRLVRAAFHQMSFDLLWVDPDTIPGLARGAHDFWYNHPWVSTDVLIQLLFQARPEDRGLLLVEDIEGRRAWTFGADYPQRATEAIERLNPR